MNTRAELQHLSPPEFKKLVNSNRIDHLDFGCSKGGSLDYAKKRLGGKVGLGIDIDPSKVSETLDNGYKAVRYDINKIPDEKLVQFTIMSHFLEHIPNFYDAEAYIRKACAISRDFVYIQQPFFDADIYLFKKGLKFYWSDWRGHPNRMTSLELMLVMRNLEKQGFQIVYSILGYKKVNSSADIAIHTIESPRDSIHYNPGIHPKKGEVVNFTGGVFYETQCLITFPNCNHQDILNKLRFDAIIHTNLHKYGSSK